MTADEIRNHTFGSQHDVLVEIAAQLAEINQNLSKQYKPLSEQLTGIHQHVSALKALWPANTTKILISASNVDEQR
jgi:hypothetical protein